MNQTNTQLTLSTPNQRVVQAVPTDLWCSVAPSTKGTS